MMKNFRPIFLAAFFASLAFVTSLRAAIPPAENLLPSDTLFVFTAPDFAALKKAAGQSPQWLFWNDPAMKPFHDKFMSKLNGEFVGPLERDLGVKLADFAGLPQGQLTFAVTQNGWNGIDDDKPPGIILLLDAKDKGNLLATNLAALKKKWTADGKPIHAETVRGVEFSVVPLSSNDIPASLAAIFQKREPVQELGRETKPIPPGELVIGQFESLLIAGNSIKAVEPVVARLTGGSVPALGDNAAFAADQLAQFHDAPLYCGWLNVKAVFNVLAGIQPEPPNPLAPDPVPQTPWNKILTASGLAGVKSASFSYRESHAGSQIDFYISAPEDARRGIFKLISAVPKEAAPPSFVPADAVKFWRWRLDGQNGWDALEKMLGDISPVAAASLDAAIGMANANAQQSNHGFDLRQYLIGNLTDDFISYQKAPADLNSAPSLFLFGAADTDQALLAVKIVASFMFGQQGTPTARDFLGRKIYIIPLPTRRLPGAGAPAPAARAIYCAAGDGYVALTTDVSMLEEYLRGVEKPPKPLNGTAGLVDAAQRVGGTGGGLFGYQDQRETMRAAFKSLKNSTGGAGGLGSISAISALPKSFRDWADFSLLPDYDRVSKYFFFSVYGGSATADGLSFKFFAPRPPQLN
ncbi:MAG TPA: hypothetical protein VGH42_11140 [Verrucomicrobiae bacterium]|jgi:hypothetical protein